MFRTGQYQIGLDPGYSFSVAPETFMQPLCDVLDSDEEPISEFQEYTDTVGTDLNGMPIEAGFPTASWAWNNPMTQKDYNTLLGYFASALGSLVYIRTRNNIGGSATAYGVYSAVMGRPTGTFNFGMWESVQVSFVMLETP